MSLDNTLKKTRLTFSDDGMMSDAGSTYMD